LEQFHAKPLYRHGPVQQRAPDHRCRLCPRGPDPTPAL
jgi:hypothetical protein